MTTEFRDDSSLSPRLFESDAKFDADALVPESLSEESPLEGGEDCEAGNPPVADRKRPKRRKPGATCDRPHSVYILRNERSALLYVGVTLRAHERWKEHGKSKPWWPEVKSIALEHFDTREKAEERERELIQALDPPHNKHHRPRFGREPHEPPPMCEDCEEAGHPDEEMEWENADDTAGWAFERDGFVFSGYWYCDRCVDIDCRPAPPRWAALGLASDPVLRDLLAARRLRQTAQELAQPFLSRRVLEAFERHAEARR